MEQGDDGSGRQSAVCRAGEMWLSPKAWQQLAECFGVTTRCPSVNLALPKEHSSGFCPTDGTKLWRFGGTAGCPVCARSMPQSLWYALVEMHPHLPVSRFGDAGDDPLSFGNSRWRTSLRARTPDLLYELGLAIPKAADCGRHDWYNSGNDVDGCYHCRVTRSTPPDAPWFGRT